MVWNIRRTTLIFWVSFGIFIVIWHGFMDVSGSLKKLVCPRDRKTPGLYHTMDSLKKRCNFLPSSVLDIGANSGYWSTALRLQFPKANFFLIEGNDEHRDALTSTGFMFEISLVGDTTRNVTYYKSKHHTGNSIFKESGWDESTGTNASIRMIDNIVLQRNVGPFDFMKIDVQGAEVLALKGARKTLQHVDVILTEASLMNYNANGFSFLELSTELDAAGFAMMDIYEITRRNGALLQFDVVWARKTSKLWSKECTGYDRPQHFLPKR